MSKDQMTVRIIKQIVREFWIPCLIGVVWASYRISLSQKDAISTFIINFASAFFLASWGIGQIVRIRRQQGIEDSFSDVRKHLADVRKTTNSTLDIATELRLHLKNLPELEILAKNVSSPVIRTQPWVAASHRPSITEETIASETAPEFTPFNALISKSINEEAAERWYREMLKSGVRPNEITFSTLISKAATEEAAEQWYHEMLRSGVRPDEITFSTLISKAASEEAAERWYHEMLKSGVRPDEITFNTLISKARNEETAAQLYHEMLKTGIRPDHITFNVLISKAATEEAAERWYHHMLKSGVRPDEITFSTLISKAATEEAAEQWYREMLKSGVSSE